MQPWHLNAILDAANEWGIHWYVIFLATIWAARWFRRTGWDRIKRFFRDVRLASRITILNIPKIFGLVKKDQFTCRNARCEELAEMVADLYKKIEAYESLRNKEARDFYEEGRRTRENTAATVARIEQTINVFLNGVVTRIVEALEKVSGSKNGRTSVLHDHDDVRR